jgi:hypothetical protein
MGVLRPRKPHRAPVLAMLAVLFLWIAPARADDAAQPLRLYEEKIKAGLVFNFIKYTNWSADILAKSNNNLRVCLLGSDSFDSYLYPLEGRSVQQYAIKVMRVTAVAEAINCNIVFIHRNRESLLPELFESLKGKYVLTISDIDQFNRQGGMVEFNMQNHRVGFFINKKALEQAGFTIQSRLEKLAKPESERDD